MDLSFTQFMDLQAKAYKLPHEYDGSRVEYVASWDGNRVRIGCDKLDHTAFSWVISNPVVGVGRSPLQEALFFNRSALKYLRAGLISEDGVQYKLLWRVPAQTQSLDKWHQDMKTYVALLTRARRVFKEAPNPCAIYAY